MNMIGNVQIKGAENDLRVQVRLMGSLFGIASWKSGNSRPLGPRSLSCSRAGKEGKWFALNDVDQASADPCLPNPQQVQWLGQTGHAPHFVVGVCISD